MMTRGSTEMPKVSKMRFVSWYMRLPSTKPNFIGKRPSQTFSMTLRLSTWFNSWCTMATPLSSAWRGFVKSTSLPSSRMLPASFL